MIKIILIEDNIKYHNIVKEIVSKIVFRTSLKYTIEYYDKYNQVLQNEIEDLSIYKIYIIDIELSNSISGVQIAEKIRKIDWDSDIIFITNHDKMFEVVYRNIFKVFSFIEKFHNFENRLKSNLELIINKHHDNNKFVYGNGSTTLSIYLKDITYINRDTIERKLVINTTNNTFYIRMNLNEIKELLDDRFIMVHRACIINTSRVSYYNWSKGYFVLDNDTKVNLLSKKYKEEVTKYENH